MRPKTKDAHYQKQDNSPGDKVARMTGMVTPPPFPPGFPSTTHCPVPPAHLWAVVIPERLHFPKRALHRPALGWVGLRLVVRIHTRPACYRQGCGRIPPSRFVAVLGGLCGAGNVRVMYHDVERGVTAQKVMDEGDGDHGARGRGHQGQTREALGEGSHCVSRHQRRRQKDVRQTEKLGAAARGEGLRWPQSEGGNQEGRVQQAGECTWLCSYVSTELTFGNAYIAVLESL